ncbi:MAG TPA: PQQ-binding-like beta-propeller repeat protein [Candidatus Cybelea sp.]|nr:PQQ-binding-like beta-propeller repeat protein [Candidatus Cybelea sp.]
MTGKTTLHGIALAASAVLLGVYAFPAGGVDWPVWGFDPARSSFNPAERTLTAANVHNLRERWQTRLGDVADTAPIYLHSVRVGRTYRPMLFETLRNGETLGIEATTGTVVWRFRTSGPNYTHSAPAADASGSAIYAPGIDGRVHRLDPSTGREIHAQGFPATITLIPETEANESALNVANGYLYATISGYDGDRAPYDGHVVAIDLSSGKKTVFNSLCSDKRGLLDGTACIQQRSGIWSRGGAVVDPAPAMNGRIYAATGNGDFNANRRGHNYGDSVISLSADLSDLYGSYTPTDYTELQHGDGDLGSTSPAMLPEEKSSTTPWMLVQGGKDRILKLVNRAALPGVGNELQLIKLPGALFATPAVWTSNSGQAWIFLGFPDVVQAYRLETDSGSSRLVRVWNASPGQTGKEGTTAVLANGMVFIAYDGALFALNALNGNVLWDSARHPKTIGNVHWSSPIVVNGWVYCSDESANLTAFALPAGR